MGNSSNKTLATSMLVADVDGNWQGDGDRDLPIDVLDFDVDTFGERVAIWFGHRQVRVGLTQGERIALIEALGGTYVAPARTTALATVRNIVAEHAYCDDDGSCSIVEELKDIL